MAIKKKTHQFVCYLILALIIVYFAQGPVYPPGSLLSQGALFALLGLSGIYFLKTLLPSTRKNLFYKSFTVLMLLNLAGYIFTGELSNPQHFSQIKTILIVALPFYPIYYFTQKKILKDTLLIWFFILLIPLSIADFYYNQNQIMMMKTRDVDNLVNNASYTFVFLIPFSFLIKEKKIISSLLVFVLLFFIIQGAKRGALVAGVIGAVFFAYYLLRTVDKKNRFRSYIVIGIVVALMSIYSYNYFLQNEFFVERMESIAEGNSSGRDTIYSTLFNAWLNSDSYIHLIFGRGFAKTLIVSGGSYAHNDWLELLTNFGLLGVVIYLTMFYAAIRYAFDKRVHIDKRLMMMAIVSMWFMTTAVSMNYTSSNAIYQNMLIAYLMANYNKKISKLK